METPIDPNITEQAAAGGHVALAALAVWMLVALVKSDKIPINIPPAARPWLAFALGQTYAVLAAVVGGVRWELAVVEGLFAALGAVGTQELGAGFAALFRGALAAFRGGPK